MFVWEDRLKNKQIGRVSCRNSSHVETRRLQIKPRERNDAVSKTRLYHVRLKLPVTHGCLSSDEIKCGNVNKAEYNG